jgi:hypothetical protein
MRLVLAALGCALLFAGCSRPEYIMPSVPLTQDMSAYQSANVEVVVPQEIVNAASLQARLKEGVAKELRLQNVVAKTDVPEPDVLVKVTVVSVDLGNAFARATAGSAMSLVGGDGEGSISVDVDVTEVKKAGRLAAFGAMGVSKDPGEAQVTVNGLNLGVDKDVAARSADFASREIARYLKTRKVVAD